MDVLTHYIRTEASLDTSKRTVKVWWDSIYMSVRTAGGYVGPRGDTRSVYDRASVRAAHRAYACALVLFLCFRLPDAWAMGRAKGGYM